MGSIMVKENEYLLYIKCFFEENLPDYKLQQENFHGPFWYVEYKNQKVSVIISGDIGFQITVDFLGAKYPFWQYDYSVNEKSKTSIENIEDQLSSLRKLLLDLTKE